MSRAGYSDDCDDMWSHIRWRGAVTSAIRGKRGQAFLRELRDALDAMPVKRLIAENLEAQGEVCAIGCVLRKRGVDMTGVDPYDYDAVSEIAGIAEPLVREIEFENDEAWSTRQTPEQRWERVRAWVEEQLAPPKRSDYVSDEFYQKALAKWQKRQPPETRDVQQQEKTK